MVMKYSVKKSIHYEAPFICPQVGHLPFFFSVPQYKQVIFDPISSEKPMSKTVYTHKYSIHSQVKYSVLFTTHIVIYY